MTESSQNALAGMFAGAILALLLVAGIANLAPDWPARHRELCDRAFSTASASDSLVLMREPYKCRERRR